MQGLDPLAQNWWKISPMLAAVRFSEGRWKPAAHLQLINNSVMRALKDGTRFLLVSLPPRHGKSEFLSKWLPFWFLCTKKNSRVLLSSYEANFAKNWGAKVRDLVWEHSSATQIQLVSDGKSAAHLKLSNGSEMQTAGVGGAVTGKGADLFIVDDPVKNYEEACSVTYQERAINWFRSCAETRLEPGGLVVVVMTRWHEKDLIGQLLQNSSNKNKLKYIRIPAVADNLDPTGLGSAPDPLGRKTGQPLWPDRFSSESLKQIENSIGPLIWSGLYQQLPTIAGGGICKNEWFRYYTKLPNLDSVWQSWDLTFSGKANSDFVVGMVWGSRSANKYLLDVVRMRADFPTTISLLGALKEKWPQTTGIFVEQAANGAALVDTLKNEIEGLVPVPPRGSKEARFTAVTSFLAAGNVFFPESAAWLGTLERELLTFPNSEYKDQVDAFSLGLSQNNNLLEFYSRLGY